MELILYKNFSKKINSTKHPTGGTAVDVKLKQGTSVESPVFMIDGIDLDVNYCKWNNHFYYVTDIVLSINNIYEIHCVHDDLATNKSTILGYTGYVTHAQSEYNKWIPDQRLTMSLDTQQASADAELPIFYNTSGSYIIAVAGKENALIDTAQVGLVCYYAITASNLRELTDVLYSDDLIDDLKKWFSDPFAALIEAHWVPFPVGTSTSPTTFIYLGNRSIDAQGIGLKEYVNTSTHIYETDVDIPWIHNDWRDFSPYTSMQIWLPFYGMVDLDASRFIYNDNQAESLNVKVSLDAISGEVCYALSAYNYQAIFKCDCSVSLSVGQTSGKKINSIGEVLGGAATAITGAVGLAWGPAGVASTVAAGIGVLGGIGAIGMGAATYFQTETSAKGGTGGFAQVNMIKKKSQYGKISIKLVSHKFGIEDPANINGIEGRPLFETRTLSSLSGYVKCAGASISIDGLSSEKEKVNQWLNSGLFIE